MNFFLTSLASFQLLISLRNIAFLLLNWGALGATILVSFRGSQAARYWLLALIVVGIALFAVSFSHLNHQEPHAMKVSERVPAVESTISSGVQVLGESVMKLFLLAASVYIVLRGLGLLLLFCRKRVPDGPVAITRFIVGALLCVGILGVGLSAHRSFSPVRSSSSMNPDVRQ
jgi:hypothetical protein